jgi:putative SOS response-associated peptidase YedK
MQENTARRFSLAFRRCALRHCRHLGELEDLASGEWSRTFAIITTDANELVADIHGDSGTG